MRAGIHPPYRQVVFRDLAAGTDYLTRSTMTSDRTCEIDGVEYPCVHVEISASSHPFFTGQMKIVDTAGRVERFTRRYGQRAARTT
ncbi:MAG: type B 50S ribosomal protein L31 [Acidimicrobiales bacterium]